MESSDFLWFFCVFLMVTMNWSYFLRHCCFCEYSISSTAACDLLGHDDSLGKYHHFSSLILGQANCYD